MLQHDENQAEEDPANAESQAEEDPAHTESQAEEDPAHAESQAEEEDPAHAESQAEEDPARPLEDKPHTALSERAQLCSQMQSLCEDILKFTRTFVLCELYLNSDPELTSQGARDKAAAVERDLMELLEFTCQEACQHARRLVELTKELPVGVASARLPEIISLMWTFLQSS